MDPLLVGGESLFDNGFFLVTWMENASCVQPHICRLNSLQVKCMGEIKTPFTKFATIPKQVCN
jgi:hypothetical protein